METASRGSVVRWLVGGIAGLVLLGGIGVYALTVYLPDLIYSRVRAEAKTAGIDLQHCERFEFTRDGLAITHIMLAQCSFTSTLPMKPAGSIEQLDVDLSNDVPTRAAIAGADVTLTGDLAILELYAEFDTNSGMELVAQRNRISWLRAPGEAPQLVIENLQRLGATQPWSGDVQVADLLRGQFAFGTDLNVNLEDKTNTKNTLRLYVEPSRFVGTLSLDFDGLPMTLLSGLIFHNVPPDLLTVQVSGNAKFELPFGLNPKQPKGQFKFSFQGLNFPVPREVAGLVYDTSPEVEGDIEINRTFSRFKVSNLKFVTGSLRMKGSANIQREGVDTQWVAALRGPLPCDAIAAAAAKIHLQGLPLGPELARAAARIGKQAIKGSVEILVGLDAQSTDLSAAKVVKTIGLGCGLKPLPLVGLAQDLIKDLPQLPLGEGTVADVLKELPSLSDLPALPTVPISPKIPKKKHTSEPRP